ncbi:sensor histidine kinase [Haloplanus aerogenes]|uniref:histidine kinase n=1 Tax=Haloplanus aerogenes TaxID=660522 RepID=A0A3M0DHN3_9EURY|nr:histidine kinase N-terminal 7TM domain-containing protein [Haloplanus aerogenes]AZH26218.1 PAS domain-containing protein [Haloplanus aerogenes]RMB18326.1 PAS domain S-box-containing protein [Haloplanus aerogenes]
MAWDPTLYTVVGVSAAVLFFLIVLAGWQYRSEPVSKAFLALISTIGGWILLYAIGLGFTTLDAQLVWQRAALAIGGLVPTLWFLFAVQYTNHETWLTRPVRAIMIIDPLVFGLLTLTNPSHGLIWTDTALVTYGSLHALEFTFGPMYLLHLGYAYVVTPIGFGLLALAAVRSTLYRTQAGLLVLGAVPPLVANGAFSLGIEPAFFPPLDYTPFAFMVTGPFFVLALFRFDLLERVPVAHKRIIADADDGFVVLDEDERVVTANPAAERILGGSVTGRPIRAPVPELADFDPDTFEGRTLTAVVEHTQRTYDLTCSELSDGHGRVVGYVLRFHDVTDRHLYQQRLKVVNRVLRHNLRNRMNVISGWADEVTESDDPEIAAAGERIAETAAGLTQLGEQARLLVETAEDSGHDVRSVAVDAHVTPLIERAREEHPDVRIESAISPGVTVTVPWAKHLTAAVGNLLDNAIKHNDAERPSVRITAEATDGAAPYVHIRVADNGPGIPETEREVLRKGTETPLEHGSGLGLWLVYWIATMSGGEVTFEANEPRGSVVTLALPSGD